MKTICSNSYVSNDVFYRQEDKDCYQVKRWSPTQQLVIKSIVSMNIYHCLVFTLISHLKVLFNSSPSLSSSTSLLLLLLLLLLFIIYIINLPVVRPRPCQVIYYFGTPILGRKHQLFDRVKFLAPFPGR
jgi:hypothetical protein